LSRKIKGNVSDEIAAMRPKETGIDHAQGDVLALPQPIEELSAALPLA
jgi:EAL domain-containing protein (putative c-di-GMP-specific phosphodiesterase class I)